MEFLKSTFVVILVMCSIPMQNGKRLKNDVTPAPTLDFTEFIEKRDFKDQQGTVIESVMNGNKGSTKSIEGSRNENPMLLPSLNVKQTHASHQPVCKYGMAEIFLFGGFEDAAEVRSKHYSSAELKEGRQLERMPVHGVGTSENKYEKKLAASDKIVTTEMIKKSKGDHHVNLEVSDMHSFEEWKNLKLQEQESRLAESEPIPSHTVRAKKTQVNYASQDCGAKVLAHNEEAKHVSAILDENKDMYMLNPCSTSIWFVIELCEPIQVQQLQLGNLELFSSAPKEFSVFLSERYPAREWHSIGTFEATNERNLQTFAPKSEGQMFAKYLKFEMLSHFSNEHFCPLTLIRVLGASIVDEFDEAEQLPSGKDDTTDAIASWQESKKVIEGNDRGDDGPINAVLNIVKTAIGLSNDADEKTGKILVFAKANDSNGNFDGNDNESIDPTAESEIVLVTNETEVAAGPRQNGTQNLITLIETGKGEDLTEYLKNLSTFSSNQIPLYIPKFIHFLTPKLNVNMCWFLEFFCKVSIASCLVHYPYNYNAMGIFFPIADYMSSKPTSFLAEESARTNETASIPQLLREPLETENTQGFIQADTDSDQSLPQNIMGEKDGSVAGDMQDNVQTEGNASDKVLTASKIDSKANGQLDWEPARSYSESTVVAADDFAQVSIEKNASLQGDLKPVIQSMGHTSEVKGDSDSTGISNNESVAMGVEIVPSGNVMLNASGMPETFQPSIVISPGTNQKDSVFMRLGNRIRVLEQDMSLSSDYLENLSQRFKKQMDEMQRAFDQTTSRLLTTGRTANENDARQTELIQQAQAEIELLKLQVQNLSLSNDKINMQLLERHACFIILEVIVFTAVLVTCLGRRIAQVRSDIFKSEAMIESLKRVVQEQDSSVRANKFCVCFSGNSKKQKTHSVQRREILKNTPLKHKLSWSYQGTTSTVSHTEKFGNKTADCHVPEQSGKEKRHSWNGDALNPKITSGHLKGRK